MAEGTKIGAYGLTEPGSGSDAGGMKTTAKLDGDNYILNGSKIFITNGGIADIYIVFAVTDPRRNVKEQVHLSLKKISQDSLLGKKRKN